MKNKLTAKQKKFADLFIETGDKQKSYLKAYPKSRYNSAAAAATRLLKNVKVKAYIDTKQEQIDSEVFKHQIVTKERILQEEGRIVRANVKDILDDNGDVKELKDMSEGLLAAIKLIKYDKIRVGTDKQGNAIYEKYIKRISFHDKGAALNRIEKCFGMHQGNKLEEKKDSFGSIIRAILAEINGQNRGKLPQE